MNRRAGNLGSAGASPAVFGAPPKTLAATLRLTTRNHTRVSREAHDTAGEAPALPGDSAAAGLS
jgi:hypothetical protein